MAVSCRVFLPELLQIIAILEEVYTVLSKLVFMLACCNTCAASKCQALT